mgnify:CR=1 FL=1
MIKKIILITSLIISGSFFSEDLLDETVALNCKVEVVISTNLKQWDCSNKVENLSRKEKKNLKKEFEFLPPSTCEAPDRYILFFKDQKKVASDFPGFWGDRTVDLFVAGSDEQNYEWEACSKNKGSVFQQENANCGDYYDFGYTFSLNRTDLKLRASTFLGKLPSGERFRYATIRQCEIIDAKNLLKKHNEILESREKRKEKYRI